eukprot:Awhi_evm3s11263
MASRILSSLSKLSSNSNNLALVEAQVTVRYLFSLRYCSKLTTRRDGSMPLSSGLTRV